jgi:cephalosporin hydroxylase
MIHRSKRNIKKMELENQQSKAEGSAISEAIKNVLLDRPEPRLINMDPVANCPVPLLQSPWEFEQLLKIYNEKKPNKILEIGSFYGGTLYYWAQCPRSTTIENIVSVDYLIGPGDTRYNEMMESRRKWHSWFGNVRQFDDIQGDSHDPNTIERVRRVFPERDVDFLFIDGDHSYDGVRRDYYDYSQFVKPGGLIVFHDVSGLGEVKAFWDEVKRSNMSIEIVESPQSWGIGIIQKR